MKLSQEVIQKIKDKKILPRPKWKFVLKNYFIWIFGIISLVIGSLAMAVIIYMIRNNDWDLHERLSGSLFGTILMTLPYFWLIILVLFIGVVYYNIRHTKTGYHYNLLNIILVSIILSVMLGQIFYNLGLGRAIDERLAQHFSLYDKMFCQNSLIWHHPDKGLIVGDVFSPKGKKLLNNDLNNNRWTIFIDRLPTMPLLPVGQRIKIIGGVLNDNQFMANEIRFLEKCIGDCGCVGGEINSNCQRIK